MIELSYSRLALFDRDLDEYKKTYVDLIPKRPTISMDLGSVTDCLTTEEQNFTTKFKVVDDSEVPPEKPREIIDQVISNIILQDPDYSLEKYSWDSIISNILEQAVKNQYGDKRWKEETIIEKIAERGKKYYENLISLKDQDVSIIKLSTYKEAKRIVEKLYNCSWTADILNNRNNVYQHSVDFELIIAGEKVRIKGIIDILDTMSDQAFDLKVKSDISKFKSDYYYYRLYIQSSIYNTALLYTREDVKPFKFIVTDSYNNHAPLLYQEEEAINIPANYNKNGIKGFITLAEELIWHYDNNIWNCRKDVFINNGIIKIPKITND